MNNFIRFAIKENCKQISDFKYLLTKYASLLSPPLPDYLYDKEKLKELLREVSSEYASNMFYYNLLDKALGILIPTTVLTALGIGAGLWLRKKYVDFTNKINTLVDSVKARIP